MVQRRSRVTRTLFRKLPLGGKYWLASDLTTAPIIKCGLAAKAGSFATPILTNTAVTNVSVAVVKVPQFLLD